MGDNIFLSILVLSSIFSIVPAFRLPHNVKPEHYDITIITHLNDIKNFTFYGTVKIQMSIAEATTNIVLHSKDLDINENDINVKSLDEKNYVIDVTNVTYDKSVDFLIINLDKHLKSWFMYELYISFKGRILDDLAGFYRSKYKNSRTKKTEWLAITQFEPTSARKAFPCFDEPALKATFSINIGRKNEYNSISNMPLRKTVPLDNMKGWCLDQFKKSVPMSTYLVGYMVSKFECVQSLKNYSHILFKICARKDAIVHTQYASEFGPRVLAYFEKYFNVSYPLPKQDMVAVPDLYPPAMENWGITTYRESMLLYDSNVSSTYKRYKVANIIGHELAHQWFGNLVTMKWWTDLWLNEGFATYASTLVLDHMYPEWNVRDKDVADTYIPVFKLDLLYSSHPLSVPIEDHNNIHEIFNVISYKKGSAVVRMMHKFLGEETFRRGVNSYLKKFKYDNGDKDDLWRSLTDVAHSNKVLPHDITVNQVMDSWTTQSGYPVITVNRIYENNSVEIWQNCISQDIESLSKVWWVPLSYISDRNIDNNTTKENQSIVWLSHKSIIELKNIAPPHSYIIFNVNMAGLYRVVYDERNWELIIKALRKPLHDGIPTLNRLQLIVDSMDFAWSGQLNYSLALRLLQYIKTEEEFLPWEGVILELNSIHSLFMRSSHYGVLKNYMRNLISPIFLKLGGFHNESFPVSDKLDTIKLRNLLNEWACRVDVSTCKDEALILFSNWMKQKNPDKNNIIPNDLRSEVYCIGIHKGGEIEWDFVWQRYLNTSVGSERDRLLRSLGCTSELWLVKRILEWSITKKSGIRQQDAHVIFHKIGCSDTGYYLAKHFFYERVSDIRIYFQGNPSVMGRYITTLASQISTQSELEEFSAWIDANIKYLDSATIAIKQSLESIKIRIQWRDVHFKSLAKILNDI